MGNSNGEGHFSKSFDPNSELFGYSDKKGPQMLKRCKDRDCNFLGNLLYLLHIYKDTERHKVINVIISS